MQHFTGPCGGRREGWAGPHRHITVSSLVVGAVFGPHALNAGDPDRLRLCSLQAPPGGHGHAGISDRCRQPFLARLRGRGFPGWRPKRSRPQGSCEKGAGQKGCHPQGCACGSTRSEGGGTQDGREAGRAWRWPHGAAHPRRGTGPRSRCLATPGRCGQSPARWRFAGQERAVHQAFQEVSKALRAQARPAAQRGSSVGASSCQLSASARRARALSATARARGLDPGLFFAGGLYPFHPCLSVSALVGVSCGGVRWPPLALGVDRGAG